MREAVASLPQGIYRALEQTNAQRAAARVEILAPDYVKENAFVLHEGVIMVRDGSRSALATRIKARGLIRT